MHTITQAQREGRIPVLTAAAGGCGDVPTDRAAGVVRVSDGRRPSTKLTARPICRGFFRRLCQHPLFLRCCFQPPTRPASPVVQSTQHPKPPPRPTHHPPPPHTPSNPGRPVHTTPQTTPHALPTTPHPPVPRLPSPYSTPVVTGPVGDVRSLLDYLLKDVRSLLDYLLKDAQRPC